MIKPCIVYADHAEEAINFYVSLFPNSKVLSIQRAEADNGPVTKGQVLGATFQLDGREYLSFAGGPTFKFTEGFSLMVTRNDQAEVAGERTFRASIDEVWELWTTKEGIESWWGPDGFSVAVRDLDLRPGGELSYAMSATGPDQIEFMAQAGMPLMTEHKLTYREVDPPRRLAYDDVADFIPGVEPYRVETLIELHEVEDGVRVVLTFDAMHDER